MGSRMRWGRNRTRAHIERLECRRLLTSVLVNSPLDVLFPPNSGVVSLRNAVALANASTSATTITFEPFIFRTVQTINVSGSGFVLNGLQSTTIVGPAVGVTINGNSLSTVFDLSGGAVSISGFKIMNGNNGGITNHTTLTFTNGTITSNTGFGGLINYGVATVDGSVISNNVNSNVTYGGGGILNSINAQLTLTNSTVSGNSAVSGGGGIFNDDGFISLSNVRVVGNNATGSSTGGGIFNLGTAGLQSVEVSGNSAPVFGGGIDNGAGPMTLTDVTVFGNTGTNSGGGIHNGGVSISGPGGTFTSGMLTLTNSTIVGNSSNNGGGVFNVSASTVTTSNSVIAGNLLIGTAPVGPDGSGTFSSLGYNLVGATDGTSGWGTLDITGTMLLPANPMLTGLGFFGGPTQTLVPMPGSPLINGGLNAFAITPASAPLTIDQRGYPRIFNGTVDIGAVESQPQSISTTSGTPLTLKRNTDGLQINWIIGTIILHAMATDPEGFVVTGDSGNDPITLDYTAGNPLPGLLSLNGTFTITGLSGANPFAGTSVDLRQSTVYFSYGGGTSPILLIQQALAAGYNGGAWNGSGAGLSGAFVSSAAASGLIGVYGLGYADSVDGLVVGQPANTVEVRYTVMGDTNLDRVVNATDAIQMARNYLIAGKTAWDLGNFNYDSTISFSDALILQANFNVVAVGSVTQAAVPPATTPVASPTTDHHEWHGHKRRNR